MTKEEMDRLSRTCTELQQHLAFLSAIYLRRFRPELHHAVLAALQDATSLYTPFCGDIRVGIIEALSL